MSSVDRFAALMSEGKAGNIEVTVAELAEIGVNVADMSPRAG